MQGNPDKGDPAGSAGEVKKLKILLSSEEKTEQSDMAASVFFSVSCLWKGKQNDSINYGKSAHTDFVKNE